jgi:SAM-dependent methyltransferase
VLRVRRFYDESAGYEAGRLGENVYRRIERDMTVRTVARHVDAPARILDVGGGPGSYLEPLAELGFDPWLCDLSQANVEGARLRARALGLTRVQERARRADATDLHAYARASFDAALVAGPFYHLVDDGAQERALAELVRVVRPGGILVCAILPRLHPLRYLLREASEDSWRSVERLDWDALLETGRYANPLDPREHPLFFTDAKLWEPRAFRTFLRRGGCRVLETLSVESFCAFMDVPLCAWADCEARYQRLLELVDRTARDEDQVGSAEHVLVVARTPARRASVPRALPTARKKRK